MPHNPTTTNFMSPPGIKLGVSHVRGKRLNHCTIEAGPRYVGSLWLKITEIIVCLCADSANFFFVMRPRVIIILFFWEIGSDFRNQALVIKKKTEFKIRSIYCLLLLVVHSRTADGIKRRHFPLSENLAPKIAT